MIDLIDHSILVVFSILAVLIGVSKERWIVVVTGVVFTVIGISALISDTGRRKQDRANNNFLHFWATREGSRDRRKPEKQRSGVTTWEEFEVYKMFAEKRISREDVKRMREQGPDWCPKCRKQVYVVWRVVWINGKTVLIGKCPRCDEEYFRQHGMMEIWQQHLVRKETITKGDRR